MSPSATPTITASARLNEQFVASIDQHITGDGKHVFASRIRRGCIKVRSSWDKKRHERRDLKPAHLFLRVAPPIYYAKKIGMVQFSEFQEHIPSGCLRPDS